MAIASRVGWDAVDRALARYQVLPADYFVRPAAFFEQFRSAVLTTA